MSKIANQMLDQFGAKLRAQNNVAKPRTCWVAAASACGKVTSRVIVASMEPFSVSEAVSAIHENLGNKVIPFGASFTPIQSEAHPAMCFASVHCYKASHKVRPADEANMSQCKAITASTYLDVQLGDVWERKEIDGKQYLLRANDDDLDEVMGIALTASVAANARVEPDGFVLRPEVGNTVTFFAAEQTDKGMRPYIDVARVTEVTAGSVGIMIEEGGHRANAYVPASSIVNIIEGAALDGNTSRADIIDFLKECYGPDYARALDTM